MLCVNDAIDAAAVLANEGRILVVGSLKIGLETLALMHVPKTAWRRTGPMPWRSAIWLNFEGSHGLLDRAAKMKDSTVVVEG